MIVLGTYFIQSNQITLEPSLGGIVVGVLSSLVLFIASFPDHDADKSKGRKTLVIVLGKKKATKVFWIFPTLSYLAIIIGVAFGIFPIYCLVSFLAVPLMVRGGVGLQNNYDNTENLFPAMSSTLMFSRVTGALFVIGFLVDSVL